jgi:hypothetical protein
MTATGREERRDVLYDQLVANPDGITVEDMIDEHAKTYFGTSWDGLYRMARDAIHDLRLFLGEVDSINLICDPQGKGERWLYRLVGTPAEATPWLQNRFDDTESRLFTIESVARSMVTATDGRTKRGRKARVTERALRRLREDLADIDLDGGP